MPTTANNVDDHVRRVRIAVEAARQAGASSVQVMAAVEAGLTAAAEQQQQQPVPEMAPAGTGNEPGW